MALGFVSLSTPALPLELAGVEVAERIVQRNTLADSAQLVLNGAGIRRSWGLRVYVGALYLPERTGSVEEILRSRGPKRISIHVLLWRISKSRLVESWKTGIERNHTAAEIGRLNDRLDLAFETFFSDSVRGDRILIDYLPDVGTVVTVNSSRKGVIPGEDFYRALLKVWLGEFPADRRLKRALLGLESEHLLPVGVQSR